MKKEYICPSIKVLMSGLSEFVLDDLNVVGHSKGTDDSFAKGRGNFEEEEDDGADFWSSKW